MICEWPGGCTLSGKNRYANFVFCAAHAQEASASGLPSEAPQEPLLAPQEAPAAPAAPEPPQEPEKPAPAPRKAPAAKKATKTVRKRPRKSA